MGKIKTNAMRILDSRKIEYKHYEYDESTTDGLLVAQLHGQSREKVFKTLVTVSPTKNYYVFIIPVGLNLDLKKAAKAAGEKSIAMIKQKELLPLTGYIHGGCSPVGMKKKFPTFIHSTALGEETLCVSAGHVGNQIEVNTKALIDLVEAIPCDLIVNIE